MQWPCQVFPECDIVNSINDLRLLQQLAVTRRSIRLWDCAVPTSGRNSESIGTGATKFVRLQCDVRILIFSLHLLMRGSSPPRWIQITLSPLAQLLWRLRSDVKRFSYEGGELHYGCSNWHQRGRRSKASAPLPPSRFVSINDPP